MHEYRVGSEQAKSEFYSAHIGMALMHSRGGEGLVTDIHTNYILEQKVLVTQVSLTNPESVIL